MMPHHGIQRRLLSPKRLTATATQNRTILAISMAISQRKTHMAQAVAAVSHTVVDSPAAAAAPLMVVEARLTLAPTPQAQPDQPNHLALLVHPAHRVTLAAAVVDIHTRAVTSGAILRPGNPSLTLTCSLSSRLKENTALGNAKPSSP